MAERMVRRLIDDLDGSEIEDGKGEQIEFELRGVRYRIDLANSNVAKLEKALAPFIESATKLGESQRPSQPTKTTRSKRSQPTKTTRSKRRTSPSSKAKPSAIRAWAAENGHEVSARGRISAEIMQAYNAAHRR